MIKMTLICFLILLEVVTVTAALNGARNMYVSRRMVQVSEGDAGVWGVTTNGEVHFKDTEDNWRFVPGLPIIQIEVCDKVYAISSNNTAYVRDGVTKSNPVGTHWTYIADGQKFPQKNIACSSNGALWMIDTEGIVYFSHDFGENWAYYDDGRMKQVTVGYMGVWAINNNNEVFYRTGTYGGVLNPGDDWVRINYDSDVRCQWISSGHSQVVCLGVTGDESFYLRRAINKDRHAGKWWQKLPAIKKDFQSFNAERSLL